MSAIVLLNHGIQRLVYYPDFFNASYFDQLQSELPWQQNEIRVFGKLHQEPRLTCWFGPAYHYSSIQWPAAPMPLLLEDIRTQLTEVADFPFNAVLANFYRNGEDSMGWHSDNESELEEAACIASMSFGAERKFKFKHNKSKTTITLNLEHGSLLLMQGTIQQHWQHQLPAMAKVEAPRINLTFRKIKV